MTVLRSTDEGRHSPGEGPWWCETWWFGFWTGEGAVAGFTELTLVPNQRRCWYRAALVRHGEPLLLMDEMDAPLPRRQELEVKAEGLWADHVCEVAMKQWTLANEAHAVALDDPDDAIGRAYGTVTPMAFDLEWYATGPVAALSIIAGIEQAGYRQPGEVHGLIELPGGSLTIVALADRRHSWGPIVLPPVAERPAGAHVPLRLPLPFDVVIDDTLTTEGWVRTRRP